MLEPGQRVALFLDHRTPQSAPGIESESDFYVVVGVDNGVFDVRDNQVAARSGAASLDGARPAAAGEAGPLVVDEAAFRAAVAKAGASPTAGVTGTWPLS